MTPRALNISLYFIRGRGMRDAKPVSLAVTRARANLRHRGLIDFDFKSNAGRFRR